MSRRAYTYVFFTIGILACFRHAPLERPFVADNQLYYYVAERVASGIPPHVSLIDHKHASSSIISGAAVAVGRSAGIDDVVAARIVSVVAAAAAMALLWLLALELTGSTAAAHASAVVMLLFDGFFAQGAEGVRPKLFMVPFLLGALLFAARERPGRSGFCATASYLCWQPAGLVAFAVGVESLVHGDRWRRTSWLVAGAVAALLLYEGYFLWHGVLGEQLRQSYLMAADTKAYEFEGLADGLWFVAATGRRRWLPFGVVGGGFLVMLVTASLLGACRPRHAWRLLRERRGLAATWLAAHAAVAFTIVDHQAYPDRFFVEPFVALFWGIAFGVLARHAIVTPRRWFRPAAAAAAAAGIALLLVSPRSVDAPMRRGLARQRLVAQEVAVLAARHDSVWTLGSLHLLGLARVTNYSPLGLFLDPRVRSYVRYREGMTDYRPPTVHADASPAVILAARVNERARLPWLGEEYRHVASSAFDGVNVRLWLRRDVEPADDRSRGWGWPRICGDAIGDRSLLAGADRPPTATDALALLRAAAGSLECPACACDVDSSGVVAASDALRLLHHALGIGGRLRCPPCSDVGEDDADADGPGAHADRHAR